MALSREEIAERYGSAILGYAEDQNVLEAFHDELQEIKIAMNENPKIISILSNPVVNIDEKKSILSAIEEGMSDEVKNVLDLILDYNRFADLPAIIDEFNNLYNQEKLIATGTATTAVKIDDDQLKRLSESYAKKHNLNEVRLENIVDPSILGGVVLKVKDLVIDGSIKNRLNKIRTQLIEE